MTGIEDPARRAAVEAALEMVDEGATVGLGSGRAVYALCDAIGKRWSNHPPVRAVVASESTATRARDAGIEIVELRRAVVPDVAFDGADEVGPELDLIKGGGAAMLREKLVIAAAGRTVIMVENHKLVDRLGATRLLPVETVCFGWEQTAERLESIATSVERRSEGGEAVVTDEGHYILDLAIPEGIVLAELDTDIKATMGVVDHGLFLGCASAVLVGQADGSLRTLTR